MTVNIELRSDTFTSPTDAMRQAMCNAIVGDDVFHEDPTVRQLEERAAALFGKQDAMFCATGTMANQIAVMVFCDYGDQVVVHKQSHIYNLETNSLSTACGVQPRIIDAPNGYYDLSTLEEELHIADTQTAATSLICLENSFNLNKGLAIPAEHINEICRFGHDRNVKVFMDGARIFNAAVALKTDVKTLCAEVDAVATCLSKGLACPVGSLLMGSSEFIKEARRMRQRLGGGWRQAGILAAAGLVAFSEMIDRMSEDHDNAQQLANGLVGLGLDINLDEVQTNIIPVGVEPLQVTAAEFCDYMKAAGINVKNIGKYKVRMMTHKDFSSTQIDQVLQTIKDAPFPNA